MGNDGRLVLSVLVAQLHCRWTNLSFVSLTKLADLTKLDPEFRQFVRGRQRWLVLCCCVSRAVLLDFRRKLPGEWAAASRPEISRQVGYRLLIASD